MEDEHRLFAVFVSQNQARHRIAVEFFSSKIYRRAHEAYAGLMTDCPVLPLTIARKEESREVAGFFELYKAVMDDARRITCGTVVTAMCRNGENFGIRISGMGDEWFTAPVNTPQGLYFTGYSASDASPDLGDSAITETFGVGGMAMIAAPAVTRFVGAGGYEDALRTSNDMMEICISRNPNFTVPTWNFQGICLGIDSRSVVEKELTPVINTGIAHKIAGYGQIGAGTVRPPSPASRRRCSPTARSSAWT